MNENSPGADWFRGFLLNDSSETEGSFPGPSPCLSYKSTIPAFSQASRVAGSQ